MRQLTSRRPCEGTPGFWVVPPLLQEDVDALHQLVDIFVVVVSGEACVQFLPEPLDGVVRRGVRGQEVQPYAASQAGESDQGLLRLVDDVVVEHDVNRLVREEVRESVYQADEQVRVFPRPLDVDKLSRLMLKRAGEVTLAVVPWCVLAVAGPFGSTAARSSGSGGRRPRHCRTAT